MLVTWTQLRHNSFSLQIYKIFSTRDCGQAAHSALRFHQSFDGGDPKCVSVRQPLEYVESVIHHRLLALSEGPPLQTRISISVHATKKLLPFTQSLRVEQFFTSHWGCTNPPGIFFGHTCKIFHLRPLRPSGKFLTPLRTSPYRHNSSRHVTFHPSQVLLRGEADAHFQYPPRVQIARTLHLYCTIYSAVHGSGRTFHRFSAGRSVCIGRSTSSSRLRAAGLPGRWLHLDARLLELQRRRRIFLGSRNVG